MPASNEFVSGLLDVIDKHIGAFGGDREAKLAMAKDIAALPSNNRSVAITQGRIIAAAKVRWS